MTSLDSILSDEPLAHERADAPESDSSEDSTETTTHQEASTGAEDDEADAQSPATGDDDGDADEFAPNELRVSGLKKVVQKERHSRKEEARLRKAADKRAEEAERRLADLARQFTAQQQQQAPAQEAQAPNDEEELNEFLTQGNKYTRRVVEEQIARVRVQSVKDRIDDSVDALADVHEDARTRVGEFMQLLHQVPGLREEFRAVADRRHPHYRNPAKFAYDFAKAASAAREVGDPVAYREKTRAEIRAEVEAELRGETQHQAPRAAARAPLKTIASSRGTGAGAPAAWAGPTSLEDILEEKPRRARG